MTNLPHADASTVTGTGTGTGHAPCHHGEILQGVFRDARGRPCPGLVTLPMSEPGSSAEFAPDPGRTPADVDVRPADRAKALRAASLTLEALSATDPELPVSGGLLTIRSGIPLGLGMGSSTSDVIASVRAVADAFGHRLAPPAIARLAVRAELACDPLMHDRRPQLFAQREGQVLEVFGEALPPVVVVGCALGGGAPVDTLSLPEPRYDRTDVRHFERLRRQLRRAVAHRSPALLGAVATASARIGQQRLHHSEFSTLTRIAGRHGALGVQIAHSGSVAGVLLDPHASSFRTQLHACTKDLKHEGLPVTRVFTPPTATEHTAPSPSAPSPLTPEESPHGSAHRAGRRPAGPDTPRRPPRVPAL
ncbi:L-threonine kinase [Streptomyces sp. YIM 130001]|uniref:GHMP family kinase ATP-binding protein n=1 Tax=Streptomyces sp. YIM 130001 TaxID=2259644 RepID=UPI000E65858C|nr:GHMP kinase [Streptomyces sp. YIM 130001]RII13149.1 L-threonine kinase [Streptomyces sp. YIM 130001]